MSNHDNNHDRTQPEICLLKPLARGYLFGQPKLGRCSRQHVSTTNNIRHCTKLLADRRAHGTRYNGKRRVGVSQRVVVQYDICCTKKKKSLRD